MNIMKKHWGPVMFLDMFGSYLVDLCCDVVDKHNPALLDMVNITEYPWISINIHEHPLKLNCRVSWPSENWSCPDGLWTHQPCPGCLSSGFRNPEVDFFSFRLERLVSSCLKGLLQNHFELTGWGLCLKWLTQQNLDMQLRTRAPVLKLGFYYG